MWQPFRNKNYPEYWNDYASNFKKNSNKELNQQRFVVFDTETTGLHVLKDRVLSIGAISVIGNVIDVSDGFELYLKQDKFNKETVEIHGIIKGGEIEKVEEEEAINLFLDYLKDAVLVAHHAAFDVSMINNMLKRLELPKLKNKVLDTGILFKKTNLHDQSKQHYGLDDLCEIFNVKKHDRHTASGDAYITALIFLKILSSLKKTKKITLNDLFFNSNRRGLL
ncbi:MAG: 3'-5' exonuclease [Flavobacteriaceae bacterium]|nr:3'-5' exonuclease [Flavobacteriaceae bacterium]